MTAETRAMELPDWNAARSMSHVGASVNRLEAEQKVTGRARYGSDMALPGQLHAVAVRSPHPHARVVDVDTTEAWRTEGVVHVLSAADTSDYTWFTDEAPLIADTVRFVGDEVAVVAAESLEAARAGADAVNVTYEALDHATCIADALAPDAVRIQLDGNVVSRTESTRGDVEMGLTGAAVVVEREFRTPAAVHHALEAHGANAWWVDDLLTLYCSTQGIGQVRTMMADRLGLSDNQVRVVAEHVGGGFGAKQVPWKPTMFAALLSRTTGRPVRMFLDRRAESLAAGKRNATVQTLRIGADDSGRLVAIDADLVADVGAYGVEGEASNLSGTYHAMYACEHVRTVESKVRTNTGPAVAFRAPGYVEATFAMESVMDELAQRLDLDPVDFRRRNLSRRDEENDLPWSSPKAMERSLDLISQAAQRRDDVQPADEAPTAGRRGAVARGRGFAAHDWMAGKASPPGYARAQFNADGSVHVNAATQDIGTGTRTALVQVACETLGMSAERIRLTIGDTAAGPPAPPSAGSATLPTMGPAVRAAANDLVVNLVSAAAGHLEEPVDSLSFDGTHLRRDDGGADLNLAELLDDLSPQVIWGEGGRVETAENVSVKTQGSALAEVEVDTDTGEIKVTRVVVAPDCGRIVNPKMVESQVLGGVTQGVGYTLFEQQVVDHTLGLACNPNLEDYLVPTIADSPEVEHAAVDLPDLAANPLGTKGIGELPLIPVPPAIANAVHDAIGVRFTELPITPRRVVEALASRAAAGSPASEGDR